MNYPTLTKEKPDCVLLCVPQAGIFPYRSPKALYYAVPKDRVFKIRLKSDAFFP